MQLKSIFASSSFSLFDFVLSVSSPLISSLFCLSLSNFQLDMDKGKQKKRKEIACPRNACLTEMWFGRKENKRQKKATCLCMSARFPRLSLFCDYFFFFPSSFSLWRENSSPHKQENFRPKFGLISRCRKKWSFFPSLSPFFVVESLWRRLLSNDIECLPQRYCSHLFLINNVN